MDISEVNAAVLAAAVELGFKPYEGPLEFAEIRFISTNLFSASFNDTRNSPSAGPVFSFDIDTNEHQNADAVREYVKTRLLAYLASPSN